jgi:hypothetical protein
VGTAQLEKEVDQRPVRRGRYAQGPAGADSPDRVQRAREERQPLTVESFEPADDLRGDLLGRLREADHVVHVPRPLGRAHAHHRPLCVVGPAGAPLLGEPAAGLVPELFGVEQDSVEVEDDRFDHA